MSTRLHWYLGFAAVVLGFAFEDVKAADIKGVVTGPKGPEAGVWVIAETTDLPTKYAKVVVTDDKGRYLIPELPKGNYAVWLRGYGLVDSPKVQTPPGKTVNMKADAAASEGKRPSTTPACTGTRCSRSRRRASSRAPARRATASRRDIKTQEAWVDTVKSSCQSCHALGSHGIRTVPKMFIEGSANSVRGVGTRTQAGQAMTNMATSLGYMGIDAALKNFADWTDRIAAGELPFAKPQRPAGHRAQHRRDDVGFLDAGALPARRHLDLPARSARQRQRPDLRRAGGEHRQHSGARSGQAPRLHHQASGAARARLFEGPADDAVGLLGRGADLGRLQQPAQRDDGRAGARVVQRALPRPATTRTSARRARIIRRRK